MRASNKKLPYKTTSCQIPEPLKEQIKEICARYKQAALTDEETASLFTRRFNLFFKAILGTTLETPKPQPQYFYELDDDDLDEDEDEDEEDEPIEPDNNYNNLVNTLTSSQKQALTDLIQFVKGKEKYYRLIGFAGTGKSYLTSVFVKWLMLNNQRFVIAAPTNKAADNFSRIACRNGITTSATTIAKLLKLQPCINITTGKEEFRPIHEVRALQGQLFDDSDLLSSAKVDSIDISDYAVILLDEFSMITQDSFKRIVDEIKFSPTKVIFIGDAAQLPPVNEHQPIVMTSPLIKQEFQLTEIVRYNGQLAKIAEEIRSNPTYANKLYPFSNGSDNTIVCLNNSKWLSKAVELFKSKEFKRNPDFVRFIVWRNKKADTLNQFVREQLFGVNIPPFVVGDRLIAKKPIFRPGSGQIPWIILMNNSEECQVIEEPRCVNSIKMVGWKLWVIPVLTDGGLKTELNVLDEFSESERQKKLAEFKQLKQWRDYYDLEKAYDYISHAYAITCHKAQGSSIDNVFLDVQDMRFCSDLQKILYTGLTRTSKQCFIPVNY